mmetsp:Transcript_50264/g.102445  ORF Transcript_50264/g.102445 Transcript_50264/m.102445 type:complete len:106 (+) Transcript_50264:26-343(+)
MFRARSVFINSAMRTQIRHAGGFLKKNIRIEENAGIREASYKTWKFFPNAPKLLFIWIIPSMFLYMAMVSENNARDQQIGRVQDYGVLWTLPKDFKIPEKRGDWN